MATISLIADSIAISLRVTGATIKLMEVFPESVKEPHPNKDHGMLPIHLALRWHGPADVILKLIELWPESVKELDKKGRLPVHYACERKHPALVTLKVLEVWPESVKEKSKSGMWPIQFACQFGAPKEVVHRMFAIDQASVPYCGTWNAIVAAQKYEETAQQILNSCSDEEVMRLAELREPDGGRRKALSMATENNRRAMEHRLLFLSR